MNALVNDQLGRLRMLFGASVVRQWFATTAGRPAKFGRYTGRTLYPGLRDGARDQKRLKTLEYYLRVEDDARGGSARGQALVNILKQKGRWPAKPDSIVGAFDGLRRWYGNPGQHWEDANGEPLRAIERTEDAELLTRHEIQAACPDLLVTNYSMLEYMLLRPIERQIFADTRDFFEAHPEEKFFLILEVAENSSEPATHLPSLRGCAHALVHPVQRIWSGSQSSLEHDFGTPTGPHKSFTAGSPLLSGLRARQGMRCAGGTLIMSFAAATSRAHGCA